ncbi:cation:proton antiporter [Flavimarina sp. Hel_I_48]|uniref:cation:proton antiporter n=1 Tax=Flavimarina sp. Hel_I_48 TaxID=1392488 RepID=UPI0009DCB7EC
MAYIPIVAKKLKITFAPIVLVLGLAIHFFGVPVKWPDPLWDQQWVKVITEIIVVISLMGAGLKIGIRYSLQHWQNTLRLIHTTMPLYIIGIFLLGKYILNLDGASSLLLAAVCAPTDPVLASDLQLRKDETKGKKNTGMRYVLTAEAGLNDGFAFPFVYLAILWSRQPDFMKIDFVHWFGFFFLYKIVIGIIVGSIIGFCYSYSIHKIKSEYKHKPLSGFVGIVLAMTVFAITEVLLGYGFLSAFFCGLFAQYHYHKEEREDQEKEEILLFTDEFEKLLIVIWIVLFGGFVLSGILNYIQWPGIVVAGIIVLVLRPLCGRIALLGTDFSKKKKWAVSFFGVKGVGSFFYLSYGIYEGNFSKANELYALVTVAVLISIIVHGLTGPRVVQYFKQENPG